MWWPSSASGDDPKDGDRGREAAAGDSGEDSSSPEVMEILSEEDVFATPRPAEADDDDEDETSTMVEGASPIRIPRTEDEAELRDLKEQFADQENLLGQLKNVLR